MVDEIVSVRPIALDRLAWARNFTLGLVNTLSDDQLVVRAGGAGNHALWIMGHLPLAEAGVLGELTGRPLGLPSEYERLFGAGSEAKADRTVYPTRAELLDVMATTRERFNVWVGSLDEDSARQPLPERMRRFAPDAISAAFTLAIHEGMHAGQIATIRAAVGMKPLFR